MFNYGNSVFQYLYQCLTAVLAMRPQKYESIHWHPSTGSNMQAPLIKKEKDDDEDDEVVSEVRAAYEKGW